MPSPLPPIKQHSSLFISVSSSKSNYPCHSTTRYRRKSAGRGFLILTALILLCLGITTTDWLLSTTAVLSKSLASLRLLKMQDDAAGTAAAATTALTDDAEPVVKNSTSTTTSSLSIFEILSRKRQAFWKDTVLQLEIQANVDCRGKEEFLSILYAAGIVTNKIKRNYPVQQPTTTTFDISSVKNVTILSTPHRAQYQSWLLETCPKLAPWSDVMELYGSQPVVMGMETCARYRQSAMAYNNNNNNTPLVGFIRVAGLYNTGTNALQTTLQRNLYRLSFSTNHAQQHAATAKHVPLLQVPWGKHLPVKYKYQNVHPVFHQQQQQQQQKRNDGIVKNPGLVLPIVLVRDPYQWAQSMVGNDCVTVAAPRLTVFVVFLFFLIFVVGLAIKSHKQNIVFQTLV
jgi:hypothetical protein